MTRSTGIGKNAGTASGKGRSIVANIVANAVSGKVALKSVMRTGVSPTLKVFVHAGGTTFGETGNENGLGDLQGITSRCSIAVYFWA